MRYNIRILSTYPPRRCGIGTFSRDLVMALGHFAADVASVRVAAIDKNHCVYKLPVDIIVDQYVPHSWSSAASAIVAESDESLNPTVVVLQHEYGLDPDSDGRDASGHNYVDTAKTLHEAGLIVIAYLHTVLNAPSDHQKTILQDLAQYVDGLLVTTESAIEILSSDPYNIDREKIRHIDHGIRMQNPSQYDRFATKEAYNIDDQFLVTTLGMRSPNKGIEFGIRGYAKFINESCTEEQRRHLTYLVAGQCHPEFEKAENGRLSGEYHQTIMQVLKESEVKWCAIDHLGDTSFREYDVIFLDTFLDEELLLDVYAATNIMLLPYLNKEQISSGILADTLGAGRVAVATKFMYAVELLDPENQCKEGMILDERSRGILVDPGEPSVDQIAQALDCLVFNKEERLAMEKRAQERGHQMRWDNTAWELLQHIEFIAEQRERVTGRGLTFKREKPSPLAEKNRSLAPSQ